MSLSLDEYLRAAGDYLPPVIVPYGAGSYQFAAARWSRSRRGVMLRKWRPSSASWSNWAPHRGAFTRLATSADYAQFRPDYEAAWRD